MFAFVLFDAIEQTVFAARDRFGIKPLYYLANRRGIAFASEIKQFCGLPDFLPRLNLARTYDFLTSGIMDHTGETLFDGGRSTGGRRMRSSRSAARPSRRAAAGAALVSHS